jgi:hypothetical protein
MLGMFLQDGRFIIRHMYDIHGRLITNNDGLLGHSRGYIYLPHNEGWFWAKGLLFWMGWEG